jgi:opacity protein-like surface antigen
MNINRKMSGTTLALAMAVALAAPGAVQAQDYQFEGGLTYLYANPDFASSDSALGIDLTWHLEPVRTGNLPLAAAAFYNRNSNVSASYLTFDDLDLDLLTLGTELYYQRFFLGAEYLRLSNGSTSDDFELAVGYVPVDGLRLAARYYIADVGDDAWTVDMKYVRPLAGGTAVGVDASVEFVDDFADTQAYAFSGDYYFNPSFSLGARIVYTDNDFDSDTAWGAGARYFFTPTISAELEYLDSDIVETFGVRIAARF